MYREEVFAYMIKGVSKFYKDLLQLNKKTTQLLKMDRK